jgi:hypothetical protein
VVYEEFGGLKKHNIMLSKVKAQLPLALTVLVVVIVAIVLFTKKSDDGKTRVLKADINPLAKKAA